MEIAIMPGFAAIEHSYLDKSAPPTTILPTTTPQGQKATTTTTVSCEELWFSPISCGASTTTDGNQLELFEPTFRNKMT